MVLPNRDEEFEDYAGLLGEIVDDVLTATKASSPEVRSKIAELVSEAFHQGVEAVRLPEVMASWNKLKENAQRTFFAICMNEREEGLVTGEVTLSKWSMGGARPWSAGREEYSDATVLPLVQAGLFEVRSSGHHPTVVMTERGARLWFLLNGKPGRYDEIVEAEEALRRYFALE